MRKTVVITGIMQIMICLTVNGAFGATYYNITEITEPEFNELTAYDINNSSMVTGIYNNDLGDQRAFVYKNGTLTDIGLEQDTGYQRAYAINDSGFSVGGRYLNASNVERGYLYDSTADTYVDIPSSDNPLSATWVYGINNSNQVTGYEIDATTGERFATFYENGVTTLLPQIGGTRSEGRSINEQGHIVGFGYDASDLYENRKAYYYDGTTAYNLGTLGGTSSRAYDINESNEIVGRAKLADGTEHAFFWKDNVMTDLGTLGGTSCTATGINEAGQIIGVSYINATDYHAFIYDDDTMYDLNDYIIDSSGQIVITAARGINDSGDIIVTGLIGSDPVVHSFIITPVPEPLSIILTSLGLGLLALRKKYFK